MEENSRIKKGAFTVNLPASEVMVRTIFALLLLLSASLEQSWIVIISAYALGTVIFQYCPLTALILHHKAQSSQVNYYSLLPTHNPEAVMVFSFSGKRLFANTHGQKNLPNLLRIESLLSQDMHLNDVVCSDEVISMEYFDKEDNKTFAISLVVEKQRSLIFVYTMDISSLVEADREVIDMQKDIVHAMGAIGETRSKETANHVVRVAEYSFLLAQLAGVSLDDAELLKMASPMHDIGKVGIPDTILNKPGKLTKEEFDVMKTHAQLGFDMLCHSQRPILKAAATVAREHHEKWDGSGYPRGLKGEDIHIYGRITALADVFDALGSDRIYKKAWPLEETLALISEQSGQHFDPLLVELFLDNLDDFLIIRDRYIDKVEQSLAA